MEYVYLVYDYYDGDLVEVFKFNKDAESYCLRGLKLSPRERRHRVECCVKKVSVS